MSFKTLRQAIKEKLLTIPEIQDVASYDKGKFAGFPAAVVFPSESPSDFETTTSDLRSYIFVIRLHQEREHTPPEEVESIMEELCDKVLDVFSKDSSLGGTCDFCLPVPMAWGYQDRDVGVCRVAEIRLTCNKSVSII